jgi:hypothetical protein
VEPKARLTDLVVEELSGDETIVYDCRIKKAHCLNRTARKIWELCDGQRDVAAITEQVVKDLGVQLDEAMVREGLYRLGELQLLETPFTPPSGAGVSRRRLLWGAAVTAMPLIFSIIVPDPARAVSPPPPYPSGSGGYSPPATPPSGGTGGTTVKAPSAALW